MRYVMGIDPGKDGGVALLGIYEDGCVPLYVCPMPLTPDGWPDVKSILIALYQETGEPSPPTRLHVCVEKVNAMPPLGKGGQRRQAGAQSSFNFGKGVGFLLGAFAAHGISHSEVPPQTWKAKVLVGTDKSKAEAAAWAYRTYPQLIDQLKRPRGGPHLGKVEALCIAHYAASL